MKIRLGLAAIALACLVTMSAGPVLAVGPLDQSQTNASVTTLTWLIAPVAGSKMDLRQSFVVGRAGTLDGFDLYGDSFGASVTLEFITSGGVADQQSIVMGSSGWTTVGLTSPFKVTAGEAVTVGVFASGKINWYGTCDNLYANGQAQVFDPVSRTVYTIPQYGITTGNSIGYCTQDFAFETYVTPSATLPPPALKTPTPAPVAASAAAAAPSVTADAGSAAPSGPATPAATDTAEATDVAAASTPQAAQPSPPGPAALSGSGGSGDGGVPMLLIGLGIVALAALGAGLYWIAGKRRKTAGPAEPGA